ncbi:MAG TPA: hydroxyacid dehydrogenase [Candidatus Dormibacteraeota bacterium]|jgi:phosphoglycerate dehydrogenase-like enzyme|nr:hydroxyacid dehydrogenase [Candidatus Dormibacteraeota bacterium]
MSGDKDQEPNPQAGGARPHILLALPEALRRELFTPEAMAALEGIGRVTLNQSGRNWSAEELAEAMAGVDALITGWGTPPIDERILDRADRLRLIAHSAGSIKRLIPDAAFERGVAVTTAAVAIAPAVAEVSLLLILLGLRQVHRYDRATREGSWEGPKAFGSGRELGAQRVGVVGAGFVGRESIRLLRPLAREVWVADPYLDPARAGELGVEVVPLRRLFAECAVITNHAPSTPETRHMIGEEQLRSMPDGALLVNTARSWSIDQEALLAELRRGRIRAALDVFDEEPLPAGSPLRSLDNVILTPHMAGATLEARLRQGDTVVAEIGRFCGGGGLRHAVTVEQLKIMA